MKVSINKRIIRAFLFNLLLLTWTNANLLAQTFTGEGDWKTPDLWDTGIVPGDNSTVTINGIAEISENLGANNADNPSLITIGQETEGTLNVTGGTLSGANGNVNK